MVVLLAVAAVLGFARAEGGIAQLGRDTHPTSLVRLARCHREDAQTIRCLVVWSGFGAGAPRHAEWAVARLEHGVLRLAWA